MLSKVIPGLMFMLLFASATIAQDKVRQKTHRLTIDMSELEGYPAAFASLENHRLQGVPNSRAELKKITIVADLWIEPDDPEVSGLTKEFEGGSHEGDDTKVAPIALRSLDDIEALPQDIQWVNKLAMEHIKMGNIFLVKSSSGRHFKVQFEKIEPKTSITIAFQEIHSGAMEGDR